MQASPQFGMAFPNADLSATTSLSSAGIKLTSSRFAFGSAKASDGHNYSLVFGDADHKYENPLRLQVVYTSSSIAGHLYSMSQTAISQARSLGGTMKPGFSVKREGGVFFIQFGVPANQAQRQTVALLHSCLKF